MGFNNNFNSMGGATVLTDLEVDSPTLVIDESNNRVGVGDTAPGTQLQVKGTAPYVTIQNSTSENSDGGCESKLIFEDHANASLGQIEVSHSGSSDDTKGKMILSTHTGSSLTAAVTIDEAQKVTAAGDVQVTGDIILDDGGSLKEAGGTAAITFDGSGHVTKIGQDSPSSADVLTYDGAKWVAEAPTVGDITGVTAGDGLTGGGTAGALSLAVGAGTGIDVAADAISVDVSDFMTNGSDNRIVTATGTDAMNAEANLSFDGSTLAVTGALTTTTTATVGTDLTVTGGDIAFGATNSTVTVTSTAHDAAGATLSVSAGAPTAGTSNNQAGGSLTISGGQGKGSGAGGDIVFKTANAGGSGSSLNALATALTISDDTSATFEDNVTVKGDIIIDDGGSLKEAGGTAALTYNGSAEITTLKVAADSVAVASDHVMFFDGGATGTPKAESIADLVTAFAGTASSTGLSASSGVLSVSDLHPVGVDGSANQILTDDGDGTVTSESKLTFDGATLLIDSDVTATTNHTTIGAHIDYDATGIIASGQTGNNVGLDLDINSNSPTMVGTVNNTGLDIDLTGGTSGTQTNIGIDVNVTGADTNYAAVLNGGNVGIGTSAPSNLLHVAGADAYLTLQNTSDENLDGEAETRVLFGDHSGAGLAMIEGSHSGTGNDTKGKFSVATNNGTSITTALTIDDTQKAVFAGDVEFGGDTHTFTSANTEDPLVIIKNTTNDTAAARLRFVKDKGAAGADADGCGEIEFYGDDDAQTNMLFAKIRAEVADASNTAEGGRLLLGVATHDGEFQNGLVIEDGSAEDEIDVIVGNGTDSVTTTAGYCKATSGFLVPEAKSVHIEAPLLASADHTATGETASMVCSASIAIRNLVAVSSAGKVANADADAEASMPVIGMAMNATASDGDAVTVLLRGMVRDDTWNWTAGNRLFASGDPTTTNGLTATAPSGTGDFVQCVAVALSADVIYLNPSFTLVEVG